MEQENSKETVTDEKKTGGGCRLSFVLEKIKNIGSKIKNAMKKVIVKIAATIIVAVKKMNKRQRIACICGAVCVFALVMLCVNVISGRKDDRATKEQQALKENAWNNETDANNNVQNGSAEGDATGQGDETADMLAAQNNSFGILPQYRDLYEQNRDLIGWLTIEDTVIDYPVMQTPGDEEYYLYRGFDKEDNKNGCLIMDTDSVVGVGTREEDYADGEVPGSNLIIHGHTMKSGEMFGNLMEYENADYGMAHNIIKFDSLYEEREYELIAVFYSQVFYKNQDVFKYYKFFQANTQEEFDDWYNNIKAMSLYDTGVTAELGDEFITLSCCAYHVEDGRFVVVGKRVK